MTRPSPFAHRFNTRNARAWASRLQIEINQARSNIYNDLREKLGEPDCDISLLRCMIYQGTANFPINGYWVARVEFADQLWKAEQALIEAQRVLK